MRVTNKKKEKEMDEAAKTKRKRQGRECGG
jgi:hypothetical protein